MREDARYLSPGALDALRRRVMRVVSQGMSQAKAARVFGVSRQSVNGWHQRWKEGGLRALRSRPRGRPPVARLKPYQAATVVRLITDRCPDQLKMPFVLWTREAVRRWLKKQYPAIHTLARREGATIYWGDETGMRSDHQAGTSFGRRGHTPVIAGTGKRFRCNMISALTNRGKLGFMVFSSRFTQAVFVAFLRRLIRHARRKLFLIIDKHPVHVGAHTQR
jgi:transposase